MSANILQHGLKEDEFEAEIMQRNVDEITNASAGNSQKKRPLKIKRAMSASDCYGDNDSQTKARMSEDSGGDDEKEDDIYVGSRKRPMPYYFDAADYETDSPLPYDEEYDIKKRRLL